MTLGPREQQIVGLVCQGLSNKEIAYRTGTSWRTIEKQVSNVLAKSNVQSRAQLIILEITGGRPWEA